MKLHFCLVVPDIVQEHVKEHQRSSTTSTIESLLQEQWWEVNQQLCVKLWLMWVFSITSQYNYIKDEQIILLCLLCFVISCSLQYHSINQALRSGPDWSGRENKYKESPPPRSPTKDVHSYSHLQQEGLRLRNFASGHTLKWGVLPGVHLHITKPREMSHLVCGDWIHRKHTKTHWWKWHMWNSDLLSKHVYFSYEKFAVFKACVTTTLSGPSTT